MIPLSETPIYAELKAEYDIQAAISSGSKRPTDRYTIARSHLLKNGRKP